MKPKTTAKTASPTEHAEQRALITWAALQVTQHPELHLLHAIPNGGARSRATAGRLKAEGVKPGVPDLFLPVPRGPYHGLYIELKRTHKGQTSPSQHWWHQQLTAQGYQVTLCKGAHHAQTILLDYLALTIETGDPVPITPPPTIARIPPLKTKARITTPRPKATTAIPWNWK